MSKQNYKIELKEPAPGDIGWLISAHGEIYSKEHGFSSEFEMDIVSKVMAFFENSSKFNKLFIAKADGKRAGTIAISRVPENRAFINFLIVKEEFRNNGIAVKLLSSVIEHAKKHDIHSISLETYSILKGARRIYKELGFKVKKIRRDVEEYNRIFDQEFWELEL